MTRRMTQSRPQPSPELLRLTLLCANLLALGAVCALLAGGAAWVSRQPYFSIKHVQIEPAQAATFEYVSPASVRATLADSPEGASLGDFFSTDLKQLRALFETVPWVRRAHVRRLWPDALRVQLEEHRPLALWNEDQMLNTWGEAFSANQGELADNLELAHLSGPAQSEALVVQRYAQLLDWLSPLGLNVQRLNLSSRHAWSVELTSSDLTHSLHLELGREERGIDPPAKGIDPSQKEAPSFFTTRLQRFVQAWPQLNQRLNQPPKQPGARQIRRADLRYPNGFAVTLAPASPKR